MNSAALFSTDGADRALLEQAIAALAVTLSPADIDKVAENVALLSKHRQVLAAALAQEAS